MNINEFLPDKVCINLDRRPERWDHAQSQFDLHRLDAVRRFPAIDGTKIKVPADWQGLPGAYGCLQSHLAVVRQAREDRLPRILIFEDDVVLDHDFNEKFSRYVRQLPADWDMLLFGGLHLLVRPLRHSDNIYRLTHSYSTFAYALNETVYDAFIDVNSRSAEPVDKNNVVLQQAFNCYCFTPPLAWVEENYSDTQDKVLYPWYVKEGIVIASPELAQMQKQSAVVIAHRDRTPDRSQTRNLQFKLAYYSTWYPDMTLLVVEHDEIPSLDPRTLRAGVQFEFVRDGGPFNPARCFQVGFEMFESSKEFFLFSESDIHLDRENVIANLELCLQYEFVSSFKHMIDLTESDTRKLLKGEDLDLRSYQRRERENICSGTCLFTRRGMRTVEGWDEASRDRGGETQSLKVRRMLSAFESPNKALRLARTGSGPT